MSGYNLVPESSVQFEQISPMVVPFIGISQENITNQTGSDWIKYTNALTSVDDNVAFNATLTAASGGRGDVDYSFGPFVNAVFKDPCFQDPYLSLRMFNGVVPEGGLFQPRRGANDGTLVMQVIDNGGEAHEPLAPDSIFHLIDTPRVPESLTLSMLGLGICVLLGKRKRHVVRKIRQIINTIESLTSF